MSRSALLFAGILGMAVFIMGCRSHEAEVAALQAQVRALQAQLAATKNEMAQRELDDALPSALEVEALTDQPTEIIVSVAPEEMYHLRGEAYPEAELLAQLDTMIQSSTDQKHRLLVRVEPKTNFERVAALVKWAESQERVSFSFVLAESETVDDES